MKAYLLLFLLPLTLAAQSARWDPPGGLMAAGETTTLQLVFDGCEPKDTPVPPKVDGLTMQFAGQATNMSLINGAYSHTISYNYAALLTRKQSVQIPAFDVATDKGTVQVPAVRFDPTGATVGNSQPLESAARSRLQASSTQVWAGEVFHLAYTIEASRGYYPDFGHGAIDWNPDPLVAEDWSQPEPFEIRTGSEPETGLRYHTRALAHKPGSYHLNPVNQLVNLSVGVTGFGFFQQRQYQQFSVASDTPTVDVRPLPPAPAGFSGAVGRFKLVSKVVPRHAAVGEPITWTLELTGTGNWPDIAGLPSREISRDFQVITPTAKRTPVEKKIFDSKLTEDVVLMPTKPGVYPLRSVSFTYFDPASGTYKSISTPPAEVTIAAPAPSPSASVSPAVAAPAPGAGGPGGEAVAAPAAPAGLPRDPLPESDLASAPLGPGAVEAWVFAPFLLLLLFWVGLAARRALRTDPALPRREARQRLAATLARLGSTAVGSPASAADLVSWQRDAAVLWSLPSAAPTGGTLADPAWSELWNEADRAIFGPAPVLPPDWVARARSALAAKPAPRFSWSRTFHGGNLFPLLAAALALAAGLGALRAASGVPPAAAYRQADFATAEAGWRARLAAEPLDWTARHNLSLALAQQNRWDEAVAQAAAAFVQQPSSEAVRWQFDLACAKAGFAPEALLDFLSPGPREQLARLESPSCWQTLLIVGAWLAAAALGVMLARGYGLLARRWIGFAAGTFLALAVVLALASVVGWTTYGAAADAHAVLVWRNSTLRSIPTEADAAQKTTPLGAGTLARSDRSFLGWRRLRFANGQTGWVRNEEAVWLWK